MLAPPAPLLLLLLLRRIKYYSKEVVVFRYDLMKQMRRRCLLTLPGQQQ